MEEDMTISKPNPRGAMVAFTGTRTQAMINALGAFLVSGGGAWDAEDCIYSFRDQALADRATWLTLETTISDRADPEAALQLAEGMANGAPEGLPANPTQGTEADVVSLLATHALTDNSRKARMRALSRMTANREQPSAVLSALVAAISSLPAV